MAQSAPDFSDWIIPLLLHRTILFRSWLCLQAALVCSNSSTRGFFLLCVSVCKRNCGYSQTFIRTASSGLPHCTRTRGRWIYWPRLSLVWVSFGRVSFRLGNLAYISVLVQTARLWLDLKGPGELIDRVPDRRNIGEGSAAERCRWAARCESDMRFVSPTASTEPACYIAMLCCQLIKAATANENARFFFLRMDGDREGQADIKQLLFGCADALNQKDDTEWNTHVYVCTLKQQLFVLFLLTYLQTTAKIF